MQSIRIRALRHSAFYTPLLLTIAGGYLQRRGLAPVYDVAGPGRTVEGGLLAGEIDVAQSAVAAGFAGLEQGRPSSVRHFAQINERDGFFLTRRGGGGEFDWPALMEQPVLVDHLFQPLAMLRFALSCVGVDYSCLHVIDAGDVESMDRAFRGGEGRYIHQQGPYAQQLEEDGIGQVVASVGEIIGPVAFSSLCATPNWLASDMARSFMAAYAEGRMAAMQLAADDISHLIQPMLPGIKPRVLSQTIGAYQLLGCWSGPHQISEASYAKVVDIFEFAGQIRRRYAYDQLVCDPPAPA